MTKKFNLRGGDKGDGFPSPKKLSFFAFFHIFQKTFFKRIQTECARPH